MALKHHLTEEALQANQVSNSRHKTIIYVTMEISGKLVIMQYPFEKYLPADAEIQETGRKLTMYSKSTMPLVGTSKVLIQNTQQKFSSLKDKMVPLNGDHAAQQMNLISVLTQNIMGVSDDEPSNKEAEGTLAEEEILTYYASVFNGLGKFKGNVHLQLCENISPTIIPP